jgi:WD40 repeat protein
VRDVEDRAWEVVRRAYEEQHVPTRPRHVRRAFSTFALRVGVFAAAAALVAALSSPGEAVFKRFRAAVGVEHAAPALFSLPAPGRLLVVSPKGGGVWLVRPDGFKRRLGSYDDAAWSPHGRFVVATAARNQLIALDPDGNVRWTLTRRAPASPAWEGSDVDTRIAYLAASGLRVVAGDGTGDHLLDGDAADVPPAWDPARVHTVAYSNRGAVVLRTASGRVLWRAPVSVTPSSFSWSSDGRLLAVVSSHGVVVLDARGRVVRTVSMLGATFLSAAFSPRAHRLAVELRHSGRSEVRLVDVDRPGTAALLFGGPGALGDLAWSPNGEWLLVGWPAANQWVFLHGARVRAVSNIREQFPRADRRPPTLEVAGRWCCAG